MDFLISTVKLVVNHLFFGFWNIVIVYLRLKKDKPFDLMLMGSQKEAEELQVHIKSTLGWKLKVSALTPVYDTLSPVWCLSVPGAVSPQALRFGRLLPGLCPIFQTVPLPLQIPLS